MGGGLKSFWMGGDSNHGPSGPEAETLPLRHSPLPKGTIKMYKDIYGNIGQFSADEAETN